MRQSFKCTFIRKIIELKYDEAEETTIVIKKTFNQEIVIAKFKFKSRSKVKRRNSFESFKFEEFTINLNLTSTKSRFERTSYEQRLITYDD